MNLRQTSVLGRGLLLAVAATYGHALAHEPLRVTDNTTTPQGQITALQSGRVITGTGAPPIENCTVLIRGERILAVGKDLSVPVDAEVHDLSGLTVLPGLLDMHAHFYANFAGTMRPVRRPYARLFLAGGVTSVFSAGAFEPEAMLTFRDAQRQGDELGPRIYCAGPYIDHVSTSLGWVTGVEDADDLRQRFLPWKKRIDGVKVYMAITEEELRALIEEAHSVQLTVTGHLESVTAVRAIDLGIDRLEHGIFAFPELGIRDASKGMDVEYLRKLASIDFDRGAASKLLDRIIKDEVVLVPTTVLMESVLRGPLELSPNWRRFLGPEGTARVDELRDAFARMRRSATIACGGPEAWTALVNGVLSKQHELIRRIHERGGSMVAGTDPVFVDIVPGYGVHREAEHFVTAGMSNLAAIRACTLDPARALGVDQDLGSIEPGKLADLVVVAGNPSEHIETLSETRLVFQGGKPYSPHDLRKSVIASIE